MFQGYTDISTIFVFTTHTINYILGSGDKPVGLFEGITVRIVTSKVIYTIYKWNFIGDRLSLELFYPQSPTLLSRTIFLFRRIYFPINHYDPKYTLFKRS